MQVEDLVEVTKTLEKPAAEKACSARDEDAVTAYFIPQ
jgi:hypothetical protein